MPASLRPAHSIARALILLVLVLFPSGLRAGTISIGFEEVEGFVNGSPVGDAFGASFTNAIVLTEGLNEFEFPPHAGVGVAVDDFGPMFIEFSSVVSSFSGYFTYTTPIVLEAFDATNNLLGSVNSLFFNNMGDGGFGGGEAGSAPNELLTIAFAGIRSVQITGAADGASFTVDDIQFETAAPVPDEPSTAFLLAMAMAVAAVLRKQLPRDL